MSHLMGLDSEGKIRIKTVSSSDNKSLHPVHHHVLVITFNEGTNEYSGYLTGLYLVYLMET